MSALQLQTSSRIVEAMGSMIYDAPMVNQVINYIITLRNEVEPCQFSVGEMRQILADGTAAARRGEGKPHAQFAKEVESWYQTTI